MSSSNSTKILKIQKKAARLITNSKNRHPSNPLFYELKILPYNLLQKQAKLHFMHSIEYKYAPSTFQEVWQKNEDRNLNYELRNNNLFSLPKVNLASLKNLPFSPTLLNGIFWVIYASRTIKPPSKLTSNITYWKNCLPPPPTHSPLPPLLRPPPSLPSNNFSSPKHPQLTLCPPCSLYLLIPNPTPYFNFFLPIICLYQSPRKTANPPPPSANPPPSGSRICWYARWCELWIPAHACQRVLLPLL